MLDALGPGTILGYCTNVHAGATYQQTLENLEKHAVGVRQRVSPTEPMGVGLWLSARAARQLLEEGRLAEFREWLSERGLLPFTFNGFPHGDFHQDVVKFKVYHPDWSEDGRLEYTIDLANIFACLLPEGGEGSISTLPLGWSEDFRQSGERLSRAAEGLRSVSAHLARLEAERGKLIHLNLEPEPGCRLTTSEDLVEFFEQHLLGGADEDVVRRHLRVCHDVCHAAVMFEDQEAVLDCYQRAGIAIGKVQLSSAIRARFDRLDDARTASALAQLRSFAEDRYLHQTAIRRGSEGGASEFIPDLPEALGRARNAGSRLGEWRVHFHVPLYLKEFGLLETTQDTVRECLSIVRRYSSVKHFEAETYAWSVLPTELQQADLADGIAREIDWVRHQTIGAPP